MTLLGQFQAGLSIFSTITVLYLLIRLIFWVWLYIRPSSLPRYLHGQTTAWALVTGASDGIGKEFARELLAGGFNVILHGRNEVKLSKVKSELLSVFPSREIEIAVADASILGAEASVVKVVGDRNLTVLVNNVGGHVGGATYRSLEEYTADSLDANINVNLRFPTHLTQRLLPLLKRNQPSLIINIGSLSAVTGPPYLTIYAGSKAYNQSFSESLSAEMRANKQDVEVLFVQVGEVVSGSHEVPQGFFTPDSKTFAKASLKRVGCGYRAVLGFMPHSILINAWHLMPVWEEMKVKVLTEEIMKKRKVYESVRVKQQ